MTDVVGELARALMPDLSPPPAGMHWHPTVTRELNGEHWRFTATWRLVPTLVFDEDD